MHAIMEASYNYSFSATNSDKLSFNVLEAGSITEALTDYQVVDAWNRTDFSNQGSDANGRQLHMMPTGAGFQGIVGRSDAVLTDGNQTIYKGATNGFYVLDEDIKLQSAPGAYSSNNSEPDDVFQFPNTQLSWTVNFYQNTVGLLDLSGSDNPGEVESINEFALALTSTQVDSGYEPYDPVPFDITPLEKAELRTQFHEQMTTGLEADADEQFHNEVIVVQMV